MTDPSQTENWQEFFRSLDRMKREELPPIYQRLAAALDDFHLIRFGTITGSHNVGSFLTSLREEGLDITGTD